MSQEEINQQSAYGQFVYVKIVNLNYILSVMKMIGLFCTWEHNQLFIFFKESSWLLYGTLIVGVQGYKERDHLGKH